MIVLYILGVLWPSYCQRMTIHSMIVLCILGVLWPSYCQRMQFESVGNVGHEFKMVITVGR